MRQKLPLQARNLVYEAQKQFPLLLGSGFSPKALRRGPYLPVASPNSRASVARMLSGVSSRP